MLLWRLLQVHGGSKFLGFAFTTGLFRLRKEGPVWVHVLPCCPCGRTASGRAAFPRKGVLSAVVKIYFFRRKEKDVANELGRCVLSLGSWYCSWLGCFQVLFGDRRVDYTGLLHLSNPSYTHRKELEKQKTCFLLLPGINSDIPFCLCSLVCFCCLSATRSLRSAARAWKVLQSAGSPIPSFGPSSVATTRTSV